MFGIGSTELAIILVFGFLLFGPDKLPQMGRTIGRALRQFRETQEKLTNVVQAEVVDPMTAAANAPMKKAVAADDDDADVEDGDDTAAPAHKETFAERRARLAAEKAAAKAEVAGEDADEGADTAAAAADAVEPQTPAADAAESEPAAAAAPEPEAAGESEPEIKTTADLYARRPRKHKLAAESDAAPESASNAEGEVR